MSSASSADILYSALHNKTKSARLALSILVLPALTGCLGVADGWADYRVQGTIIDAASKEPLQPQAVRVQLVRDGEVVLTDEVRDAKLNKGGGFEARVTVDRGGGLFLWPCIPLFCKFPRLGRPPQAAEVSIALAGQVRRVTIPLNESMIQVESATDGTIVLGKVEVPGP